MATLQNLIDDTRTRLADLDDKSYTDAMLTTFANEGQKKMAESLCCSRRQTIGGITTDFIPMTDLARRPLVISLVQTNGAKLDFVPLDEIGQIETSSTVSSYYIITGYIYVNTPLVSGDSTKITYLFTPYDLASAEDASDIPDNLCYGVVSWMEYRCRALDREGGLTERAYNEYVEAKNFAAVITQSNFLYGGFAK